MTVKGKRRLRRWIVILAIVTALVVLARWGINQAYRQALARAEPFEVGCESVWAHRGHVGSTPANSIEGVRAALAAGASGVEVDLQYMPELDRFLLAHDDVEHWSSQEERLTLDELLIAIHANIYWWLDAKNLRNLWPWQADDAVARLKQVLMDHKARQRSIVETSIPLYLEWVKQAGIGTMLAVRPNNREHPAFVFWTNIYLMKWFYSWGPFNAITMGWDRYTPKVQRAFGRKMTVNLSTFVSPETMARYASMENVEILLIDGTFFNAPRCHTQN